MATGCLLEPVSNGNVQADSDSKPLSAGLLCVDRENMERRSRCDAKMAEKGGK